MTLAVVCLWHDSGTISRSAVRAPRQPSAGITRPRPDSGRCGPASGRSIRRIDTPGVALRPAGYCTFGAGRGAGAEGGLHGQATRESSAPRSSGGGPAWSDAERSGRRGARRTPPPFSIQVSGRWTRRSNSPSSTTDSQKNAAFKPTIFLPQKSSTKFPHRSRR
jgi:hypothetical protein